MLQLSIIGNITRNAEVREINQRQYASFTVAVNDRNGENATFINVLRGGNFNGLMPYLTKGQKVYVSGDMSARAYTTQQGDTRPDITCWAQNIELCGARQDQQPAPAPVARSSAPAPRQLAAQMPERPADPVVAAQRNARRPAPQQRTDIGASGYAQQADMDDLPDFLQDE